jgi:hypothetical protein
MAAAAAAAAAAAFAVLRGEPVFEEFEGVEHDWCSVVVLRSLQSLTRLAINVRGIGLEDPPECNEVFWRSMAQLTTLRDLYINELDMEYFGGIVELVSCTQLTHLMADFYAECFEDFEMRVRLLPGAVGLGGLTCGCYCGFACLLSQPALIMRHGARSTPPVPAACVCTEGCYQPSCPELRRRPCTWF